MKKIFISYSRKNTIFADALATNLEKTGMTVWIDRRSIGFGEAWEREIYEAIQNSDIFILCLSIDAVKSQWVRQEIKYALLEEKKIIPVMVQQKLRTVLTLPFLNLTWPIYTQDCYKIMEKYDETRQVSSRNSLPFEGHDYATAFKALVKTLGDTSVEITELTIPKPPVSDTPIPVLPILLVLVVLLGSLLILLPDLVRPSDSATEIVLSDCVGNTQAARIVISDFYKADETTYLIEDEIYDEFVRRADAGYDAEICRLKQKVENVTQARTTGKKYQATLVVWGRIDTLLQVNVEAIEREEIEIALPSNSLEVTEQKAFRQLEQPAAIAIMCDYILLLNAYFTAIDVSQPLASLETSLQAARGLEEELPLVLAEGYFLVGYIYEELAMLNENEAYDEALAAYAKALQFNPAMYEATINRNDILVRTDKLGFALKEYDHLIETLEDTPDNTDFLGMAYLNRALLQPKTRFRDQDFEQGIALLPMDGYLSRGIYRLFEQTPRDLTGALEDFQRVFEFAPTEEDKQAMLHFICEIAKELPQDGQTLAALVTDNGGTCNLS